MSKSQFRFYLGTHMPNWLWDQRFIDIPLFVSRRRLADRKNLHEAVTDWALDSGGFTEISMYGRWRTSPEQYVGEVRRWSATIGRLEWAAIQDWMCEPMMIAKTGLTIAEHQRRTIESLVTLRRLAPELPWAPVLQGYRLPEYVSHVHQYADAGFDLSREPRVGLGSVCRRQATREIAFLVEALVTRYDLRLHGFGMKAGGVARSGVYLESSDSLAWSCTARRSKICLPGHESLHKNCANCVEYALRWRADMIQKALR